MDTKPNLTVDVAEVKNETGPSTLSTQATELSVSPCKTSKVSASTKTLPLKTQHNKPEMTGKQFVFLRLAWPLMILQ